MPKPTHADKPNRMSKPPATPSPAAAPQGHEPAQRPLSFALIRRLLGFTRPYAGTRNGLLACVVVRSIQLPLLAWAIGAAITGPIGAGDLGGTLWAAAGFAALALVTQVTFHFRLRLALRLGEWVIRDVRMALFRHLQSMTLSFYNRTKTGRIISRLTSDVEAMRVGVQDVLFVSMVQVGQMLVAAALMLFNSWRLFLVVLAFAPVLFLVNRVFRGRLAKSHQTIQESFSRVTSSLAEAIVGVRVTQGFVRQQVNAGLFQDLVADHSRLNVGQARVSGVFLPLLEFASQFFIALLLIVGGWLVLRPEPLTDMGALVQFFFLAGLFFSPLQSLGVQYNNALAAMAGAERVFRLLDTPPDWQDPPDARAVETVAGRLELQDVGFAYVPDRPVLRDVSFVAEAGQTIALVGHTGSGKSTVINLIAKFYQPCEGRILLDANRLRQIRTDSLHAHMGIVLQQNFLFSGTVIDNIRLGRPDARDEEVVEAARRLNCLDLIESLPKGLQTVVGERGSGISLGQRQVICFARAMLADPAIVILDEATSSVDVMTEVRIQQALEALLSGRTCFVVAHRLSTIRHADRVIVFDRGCIIEQGSHEDLLAIQGVYASLYRQFIRTAENPTDDKGVRE